MSSDVTTADGVPVLELRSETTPVRELARDLWKHRDLFPLLARQHFRGQFRAARLGVAWSALQPLIRGAVLAVVFTVFIPISTGDPDLPYPAFVLGGTAAWTFMSQALIQGTTGITGSAALAGRVYFPRLLLPAMPAAAALPSYGATLVVVIGLSWAFGAPPTPRLFLLPAAVAVGLALVAVASAVLALLHVYFRDVGQLVTAGVGILFYATPVIYPPAAAGRFQHLLELNPLAGAVGVVRWSLFGGEEALLRPLAFTIGWTIILLVAGIMAFRTYERICVDRL